MQSPRQAPQEELIDSVKELLDALSARVEQPQTCSLCGSMIDYVDCIFQISGTQSKWSVRLPVCLCERSAPPESTQ